MKSVLAIIVAVLVVGGWSLQVRDVKITRKGVDEDVFTYSEEEDTAYLEFLYSENEAESNSNQRSYELEFKYSVNDPEESEKSNEDDLQGTVGFEVFLNGIKLFEKFCSPTVAVNELGLDIKCDIRHVHGNNEGHVFLSLPDMSPKFDGQWTLRAIDKDASQQDIEAGSVQFTMQPFLRCSKEIVQPQLKMDEQNCRVIVENEKEAGCSGLTYPAPSDANLMVTSDPEDLTELIVNLEGIQLTTERVLTPKGFALFSSNFEGSYISYTRYTPKTADIKVSVGYKEVFDKDEGVQEMESFTFDFEPGCFDFTEFCKTQNETFLPTPWPSNFPTFLHTTHMVCHMENVIASELSGCRDEVLPDLDDTPAKLVFGCEEGCSVKWDVDNYVADMASFKCDSNSLQWLPDSDDAQAMNEWFTCECVEDREEESGASSTVASLSLLSAAILAAIFSTL